jgi:hypothetical protein
VWDIFETGPRELFFPASLELSSSWSLPSVARITGISHQCPDLWSHLIFLTHIFLLTPNFYSKIPRAKWHEGEAQVIECLLCKHKAPSSNTGPTKNKQKTHLYTHMSPQTCIPVSYTDASISTHSGN